MRYRELGKTGLKVSEIGFGGWGIGGAWWSGANDEESLRSMKQALELGVNFLDTAPNYGDGRSEQLIGAALRGWSGPAYVATKVNPKNMKWPAAQGTPLAEVFPADWIISSTEKSLKNLGREQIDIQLLHVWLDEWAGLDEWKEACLRLKTQGKVKSFGVSLNYPLKPDYGAQSIATGLIDCCEVVYNIYERAPEDGLFQLALDRKVGIIVKSPLDEGALTGRVTPETVFPEGSFQDFYFHGDRKQEVARRAKALEFLLHDGCETLSEAALRFCLSHQAVSTIIVGMRKPAHAQENVRASDQGRLPAADLAKLKDHAWPHDFWA